VGGLLNSFYKIDLAKGGRWKSCLFYQKKRRNGRTYFLILYEMRFDGKSSGA